MVSSTPMETYEAIAMPWAKASWATASSCAPTRAGSPPVTAAASARPLRAASCTGPGTPEGSLSSRVEP